MVFKNSLLAFDVDGTLLNSYGELTQRTIAAIASASEQGATITLATGRSWSELDLVMEAIPEIEYAICTNGLEAYDRAGQCLYTEEIPEDLVGNLIKIIRTSVSGVSIGAGIGSELYAEPEVIDGLVPGIEIAPDRVLNDIMDALTANVRDLLIYHPNYVNKLDELFAAITDIIDDRRVDVVYSGLPMIEIVPAGSGKGTCLAWMSDHLGIEKEAVFAFGDGMNDLQMLSWAGTGLAMGQSSKTVKTVADNVIGTVDQEGIAEWIEAKLGK
ncbi:MAG: hypothetical protein CL453_04965 [Acidimicrobiaceae bacterium]|nr:hypothetical protein [Acidimicrobiaceae bacterium]